jgi:TonB family protein
MRTASCFLLVLSLLLTGVVQAQTNDKKALTIAEHMPEFPGGNDSLSRYMADNVIYPDDAIDGNIQGKVYVEFIIDTAGNVIDPKIIKSVHPLLDSAAIAVVRYMPPWKPGEDGNRKVPVYVKLPVTFHLEDDTKKTTAQTAKVKPGNKSQTKLTTR